MASDEQAHNAPDFPNTILWTNDDMTTLVLDIPGSIKDAQGPVIANVLMSREALDNRLHDYEPKSTKTQKALEAKRRDTGWHQAIAQGAGAALEVASSHMRGRDWCLERALSTTSTRPQRKRSRDDADLPTAALSFSPNASNLPSLLTLFDQRDADANLKEVGHDGDLPESAVHISNQSTGHYGWNRRSQVVELDIIDAQHDAQKFYVPGSSAFLVCPCEEPILIHKFIRESTKGLQRMSDRFDVILLDPPWPNLSAGRRGSYLLSSSYDTVQELLLDLPVPRYCAVGGFVAVWVTNNERVHDMILDSGGLFDQWGLTLVEEWVWVKVTKGGDPILALDGLIKKPYEILLIAQKHDSRPKTLKGTMRRRYLFAVPDLHSRKPCLKALFDTCLSKSQRTCCVLEIFARHLVQGWSSWGNEPLQFNWKGHWM